MNFIGTIWIDSYSTFTTLFSTDKSLYCDNSPSDIVFDTPTNSYSITYESVSLQQISTNNPYELLAQPVFTLSAYSQPSVGTPTNDLLCHVLALNKCEWTSLVFDDHNCYL